MWKYCDLINEGVSEDEIWIDENYPDKLKTTQDIIDEFETYKSDDPDWQDAYSNWEELYRKIGIKQEKIKSGEFKDIMSADRPMTNKEREIIQGIVNDTYEGFVQTVAEGRKMDINTVRALADGRIYTGNQAKAVGLVDDLGNMYDAIDAVAKAANIKGKPVVKEFGNDNPFAKLTGSSSKAELINILLMLLKNEDTTNMGLLAPQEKW